MKNITTETEEIHKIIRNLHPTKLENIDEMDDFLDKSYIPKLNQEWVNYLNRPKSPKEIEIVIKTSPPKTQEQMVLV